MSFFLTRCPRCHCLLKLTPNKTVAGKRTIRCPRCQEVQTVSAPKASHTERENKPTGSKVSSPFLLWFEQKVIWLVLPLTIWLAWSEITGSNRSKEVATEKRATEFISSNKLRLPLRLWKQFQPEDRSFSVRMPGNPRVSVEPARKTDSLPTKTWSVVVDRAPTGDGEIAFHVSSFKIPNTEHINKFQGTLHWLTCMQAQDFPDLQKCVVRPMQKNGADGGEFFLELGDAQVVRRAYVDRLNVYYLTCVGSNLGAYQDDWRLFLDSFEFQRGENQQHEPEALKPPK